jgi:3-mercaptopyruvate sulfurtransferase SseA
MTAWSRPLIETADLAARLGDPRLRLFECTVTLTPLADSSGYQPPSRLRELFAAVGALGERSPRRVITYCGGGIAASSDALILTLLGAPDVAVYDNSLSEWARDPSLPMEP